CSGVRKRLPKARIIAVCDDDALVAGADAVLRKPLDFQRLNQDLRPLLRDPAGDATGARRRVLIIDDDADVLAVTRQVLESAGCVVTCIADPGQSLRTPPGGAPDPVPLRVVLPGRD